MQCLGCKLANKQFPVHVVYEDQWVCCILDHEPYNEGHVLILPKRHVTEIDELDQETATAVMDASILLSKTLKLLFQPDGITICQNGGVFNELTHYHMHVVPRFKEQSFANFYSEQPLENEAEKKRLVETKMKIVEIIMKSAT